MKRFTFILLSIIMGLAFSGCTVQIENDKKTFSVEEYYLDDYIYRHLSTVFLSIDKETSRIVDQSYNERLTKETDIYDLGIITIVMNDIENSNFIYNNELNYEWNNVYNYNIYIEHVGYNEYNRVYSLKMEINKGASTYTYNFILEKGNGYWYVQTDY